MSKATGHGWWKLVSLGFFRPACGDFLVIYIHSNNNIISGTKIGTRFTNLFYFILFFFSLEKVKQ